MKKIRLLTFVCCAMMISPVGAKSIKSVQPASSSINAYAIDRSSEIRQSLARTPKGPMQMISENKVVCSKTIKKGRIDFVQDKNGFISKCLVPNNVKLDNKLMRSVPTRATSTVTPSFYENWSGYNGTDYDWIPTNWSDVSKTNPAHVAPGANSGKLNLTWTVTKPNYEEAIDGDYVARCQVSMNMAETGEVEVFQDEWLISPSINVKANENLYFYLGYRPGWTLLDLETFKFTAVNNLLEVQISDDGGVTWTKKWDNLADAKSRTEEELTDDLYSYSSTWLGVHIDLNQYEGKSIKVAFRYFGKSGESVIIDAVKVASPAPAASYYSPVGYFNFGLSDDMYQMPSYLGPAYYESQWFNTSNFESETYKWDYADPTTVADENVSFLTTTQKNLKTPKYPHSFFESPKLTASAAGGVDSTYIGMQFTAAGGSAATSDRVFGVGNYDIVNDELSRATIFAYAAGTDDQWAGLLGITVDDKNSVGVKYFGELYNKPERSYALSGLRTLVLCDGVKPDTKATINIRKVDENGNIGEVIATASSDILSSNMLSEKIYSIQFEFIKKDPITQLEEPQILTIDSAIFIELSTDKNSVTTFSPFGTFTKAPKIVYSYIGLDMVKDGKESTKIYKTNALKFTNGEFFVGYMFSLDVTYTWLDVVGEDSNEPIFTVPATGDTKAYYINSTTTTDDWEIAEELDGTLPDWITLTRNDAAAESNNAARFEIACAALPGGVTGRSFDIHLSIPGSKVIFHVVQGDGGVHGVEVSAINVATVGDNFVISNAGSATSADVFSVTGQLVKTVAIEGGNATIAADNLAKGIYVFRFNDNTTVKVIK